MSDDKEIQALVLKSVENESSYRQLVPGILNEINAGKKPYITNTLKTAVNVITGSKYDASLKCYTLLVRPTSRICILSEYSLSRT